MWKCYTLVEYKSSGQRQLDDWPIRKLGNVLGMLSR